MLLFAHYCTYNKICLAFLYFIICLGSQLLLTLLQLLIVLLHEVTEGQERLEHLLGKFHHIEEDPAAILTDGHVVLAENAGDLDGFGLAHGLDLFTEGAAAFVFDLIYLI